MTVHCKGVSYELPVSGFRVFLYNLIRMSGAANKSLDNIVILTDKETAEELSTVWDIDYSAYGVFFIENIVFRVVADNSIGMVIGDLLEV